ncbi:MAG: transcription-repair coupling factor [Bacteroidales bacterium]|nr:transcription-repair coupling factor [Bacteroidales bacterium]MBR6930170.1 transcription-repair coupling factor [Bacteroidales bacterium]
MASISQQLYKNDVHIDVMLNALRDGGHLLCSNLAASSKAFVVEETFRRMGGQHLIVCADKEDAAYFYNDLESLLGERGMDYSKKQVLFYPTSYKRPYEPEKPDNTYILSRTEVLQRVSTSERKTLIVSYPEALSEKVFTRKLLAKNTFKIKVGDKINLDFLTDLLYEYEFESVDFVVEPGQFAIRGGLVDVFSFANDYPYRIEFFGDEVDSIRSFNIADQLSIEKLKQIVLLPNMQERAFIEEREAILQYLPDTTTVWLTDMAFFATQVDKEYDRAVEAFEKMQSEHEEEVKALKPNQLFSKSEELMDCLKKRRTVEFGTSSLLITDGLDCFVPRKSSDSTLVNDAKRQLQTDNCKLTTIQFHTKPQPIFSKNFNLLIDDIAEHKEEGYRIIVFSESSKQLSRIQAILNDINHKDEDHRDFETETIAIHGGFIDEDLKVCCYTDHQIFERYHRFHLRDNFSTKQAITLKDLYELKPGDYVTHIDHGIGRFDGLETIENNGKPQEAIRLIYNNGDLLYVSIHSLHRIAKYSSKDGTEPKLSTLGSGAWNRLKSKTKSKVKDIARELIKLYAERKRTPGFKFSPDNYLQNELEASFIYEDTPDQLKATNDVKRDMESEHPMDRLVCGDVGFGKTEVAMRAAFKACCDSKQVAVLVPTTVLALQHYHTFSERFDGFPVNIEYLNRFKTTKQQAEILKRLEKGEIDIIIGTHRLTGKDVKFKDLGLLIIDEEQKFGVAVKEKLKEMKANVDTLTLTATPIPRTLQFSMMGARDLSVITTPPPNRYPVQTELRGFDGELIRDAIQFEIARNGQVFFIHNRIQNIMDVHDFILRYVPGIRIAVAHGQMEGSKLEDIMLGFINGDYDVLLCTTIVESGLDIPNANTIIINDAHRYGLSDLHQLRGRVGRSNKKAFCYLLTPPLNTLTQEAQKRLRALEEFSDLGEGLNIAMRDLDIRGAGNILGAEQSGFINDIGFETYHKILDEAIAELKDTEFQDIFDKEEEKSYVADCTIETDMEVRFPADYINSTQERVSLYSELDRTKSEESLMKFTDHLIDRFGPIPKQVNDLLNTVRLRWIAKDLGFEKILLRHHNMTAYFVSNPESKYYESSTYMQIMQYIMNHPKRTALKEANDKLQLTVKEVSTVTQALDLLREMQN